MKKNSIIREIKEIISDYGSFSVGEVQADHSPLINSIAHIVALAEYFDEDGATIEIFDTKSHSSDSIGSYSLSYKDINIKVLQEILELAKKYKDNSI